MEKELELEVDVGIITVFEMNGREYIAISPLDEHDELSEEVWFYQFERDVSGGDEHELIFIEDEDEYEQVADQFDEWLDTLEFEEEG